MKTFSLAVGLLACGVTAAVAQDGRPRDGRFGPQPGINSGTRHVQPPHKASPVYPAPQHRRPHIVFTPAPSFPVWAPSLPYAARYHDTCQRKAWRLRWFERRAAEDGYFSWSERVEMASLRSSLRRSCGGHRWR